MKNLLRTSFAVAALAFASATSLRAAAAQDPGYVDFGSFEPSAKGQLVEINLTANVLKFAARLAKTQEPEAADLLSRLKHVRVHVVGVDAAGRAEALTRIEAIRRKLEGEGWSQIVSVREKDGGDNVNVHVRQDSDETIQGLVVTVLDGKGEAVLVNIVGEINADQIATIAEKFNIDPLRKVKIKASKT